MLKQRSNLVAKTASFSNEFCVEISSFRQSRMLLRHCCWCGRDLTLPQRPWRTSVFNAARGDRLVGSAQLSVRNVSNTHSHLVRPCLFQGH